VISAVIAHLLDAPEVGLWEARMMLRQAKRYANKVQNQKDFESATIQNDKTIIREG
jgi:hypothetical protein